MQANMLKRFSKLIVMIHFCLAFMFFAYLTLRPILNEWFERKGGVALLETTMHEVDLFEAIPQEEQTMINEGHQELQAGRPHPSYFLSLYHYIAHETSPLALGWLLFSLLICFLLLFAIQGGQTAVWLLPVIVLGYGLNLFFIPTQEGSSTLFPKEEKVLEEYPLTQDHFINKKSRLENAWAHYLVVHFAHEKPSSDLKTFKEQLRRGIFAFNKERSLRFLKGIEKIDMSTFFKDHPSFFLWLFYFVWNTFFAVVTSRTKASILHDKTT